MRAWLSGVIVVVLTCWQFAVVSVGGQATGETFTLGVRPGDAAGTTAPVWLDITLPAELAALPTEEISVELRGEGATGPVAPGQFVPGQIVKTPDGKSQLCFIMPPGQQAAEQRWTVTLARGRTREKTFAWQDTPGSHLDLLFDGKPVTRYVYAHDPEKAKAADVYKDTYKVFHHVFDVAGKDFITQGLGGKLYPHHRGLFIGFSRLQSGKLGGDWWHMSGGPQVHRRFIEQIAGPVLARSTALIHWVTKDGKLVLAEERTTTVYRQPPPTLLLLDFHSRLKAPPDQDVVLGGDPEHAGMQFRAHGDIDVKQTRYVFPKEDTNVQAERDLPWAAMEMVLNRQGGQRYAVQHINHPHNPKGARYSAYRNYGRFGAFPVANIPAAQTLTLAYRIWVGVGELPDRPQLHKQAAAFSTPPDVKLVSGQP